MTESLIKTEGKKVSNKRRTLIFLNINISCIATNMLGTALTTAIPPIMKDLNITVNTAQWLTSGFALFLAVMTPFTAFLNTRFKTKKLYCTAIGFFIIGLTICACSKYFWTMMLGRIIQGCGNGLLSSMAQVIILTIFPLEKRGTIMGWYGLSMAVAPIISPTIAGILVDSVGWRMIFVIAIAIMTISLICAIFIFEDVLPTMNKKFDFISLFFSALTFGGITLAVGNVGTHNFISYQVLLTLIIGLVAGIIFSWRQLHIKVPFLDIRILKNKDYAISLTATVTIQLMVMGSAIIFPVYVQQIKGYSATISGLVILPGSIATAIINPFVGKIYDKIGMKLLFIIGSFVLAVSNFSIYFINIHQTVWIIASLNILRCLSFGLLLMPLVTWAMKDIPKIKAADASALFNSIRFIGNSVGPALFISISTRVANAVIDIKENPNMYGINIVFLIMSILSVFILMLGIFACKNTPTKKNINEMEKDTKEMIPINEKSNFDIIIDKENASVKKSIDSKSDADTIINKEISIDEVSIKDKSDSETIIKEISIDKITPQNRH